jgi:hypothetical protein
LRYVIGYRFHLAAYLLQILIAIRKTGVTLFVANVAGGPLLASGLAYLLAAAASHNRFSEDTYK